MEYFGYLWLSVLIAYLLAATVALPYNYKIGKVEFTRWLLPIAAAIPGAYFYWLLAMGYQAFHPVITITVSSLLIYLSIDIKAITDLAQRILGHIKEIELKEAREGVYELANRSGLPLTNLCADNMDEDTVITATVEYTARAIIQNAIAPLFYAVLLGPLGAVVYRVMINEKNRNILNYIPTRLGFIAFWIATSTVTKNRTYMEGIVKRDLPKSKNKTDDLIVAGLSGTVWMKLGGTKEYYDIDSENEEKTFTADEPTFGDMLEPPHLSDILRANKLFHLTVVLFVALALCAHEYQFIWYFLHKFVI